jgi:hypothetical protein
MPDLSWPERIESYRRTIGVPYLSYENGWLTGFWKIGNSYRKHTGYHGGYQGNYLKRIAALFPDRGPVLHLFSGEADTTTFPGDTLDIRPELRPTYCTNAETCEGVPLHKYRFVLADPPYSHEDAARYDTRLPVARKVMATLAADLRPGAWVVWLDQREPMRRKDAWTCEGLIGLGGSTNHRYRAVAIFRRK